MLRLHIMNNKNEFRIASYHWNSADYKRSEVVKTEKLFVRLNCVFSTILIIWNVNFLIKQIIHTCEKVTSALLSVNYLLVASIDIIASVLYTFRHCVHKIPISYESRSKSWRSYLHKIPTQLPISGRVHIDCKGTKGFQKLYFFCDSKYFLDFSPFQTYVFI